MSWDCKIERFNFFVCVRESEREKYQETMSERDSKRPWAREIQWKWSLEKGLYEWDDDGERSWRAAAIVDGDEWRWQYEKQQTQQPHPKFLVSHEYYGGMWFYKTVQCIQPAKKRGEPLKWTLVLYGLHSIWYCITLYETNHGWYEILFLRTQALIRLLIVWVICLLVYEFDNYDQHLLTIF